MVCIDCRQGNHSSCPTAVPLKHMNAGVVFDPARKTLCDCQHQTGLVNWVGLELEAREQAKKSSGEG